MVIAWGVQTPSAVKELCSTSSLKASVIRQVLSVAGERCLLEARLTALVGSKNAWKSRAQRIARKLKLETLFNEQLRDSLHRAAEVSRSSTRREQIIVGTLSEKLSQLRTLERSSLELEATLKDQQARLRVAHEERQALLRDKRALLRSTSWRVTAPIRWVTRIARRSSSE